MASILRWLWSTTRARPTERITTSTEHGRSFDFTNGKAANWHQLFNEPTGGATFHQIRVADPDGDGCDEMIEGGYTMDHTGKTLFNTGISHGDRFRTSDIDPERPGLETFAIQQNAGDMLGQILYDAATGESIKKWYLSAVGDVGRGECMDLDPDHFGYEMFSTMEGMYDAKGELISDLPTYFPTEGIWWDGELDRERMDSPDGNGYNADVRKYAKGANIRLFEIAKNSGYKYLCAGSKRALFWGDIIGDWREEVILRKQESEGCTGVTGFSTDLSTTVNNIYCLQEDPAYRMQCTTKGYYQSPNTGFYLGYDMPRPQLPPCMVTDLVCQSTGTYVDFARENACSYADGKSVLFDLTTAESLTIDASLQPGTLSLKGTVTGKGTLVKTGAGQLNLTYGGTNTYSGGTILRAGMLAMGTWNTTFGNSTSTITAYGGTISIFDNNSSSAVPTFKNTMEIPQGSVTLVGGKRCSIQGKLKGNGTLKVSFPYVRGDVSMDMSDFAGTLDVTSGQFRLTTATNLSLAAVVLESDAYMVHVKEGSGTEQNLTSRLGSLASTSASASLGTGTWKIGSDGTSTTYAGTFTAAAQVTKVGEGTWTLTGTSPIGMTVSEGTLSLSSDATLDGTVTVGSAATLDLAGTAKNVSVQTGGTICVNPSRVIAYTSHVGGNLTVAQNGIISVKRAGTRSDKFEVEGTVTLNSPILSVNHIRGTYAAGDTLALFENFSKLTIKGEPTVQPAVPAEGLEWDLSTFGTDGVLRIVNATGIKSVNTTLFSLTPNPTDGICHLVFAQPLSETGTLRIVGMQGEELLRQSIPMGEREQEIDLSVLPDGLYVAIVNSGKENRVQKIVKK